jgi:hypothetical protein
MKFIIQFTNNIELIYDLVNEDIVNIWKELISSHTVEDCCPNNHYIGYASPSKIQEKIDRLYELCDLINERVPNRTIKHEITPDGWLHALSLMHVHFPDLKNDEQYRDIWGWLTEYNDIIHWLESTLPNLNKSSLFRITLDFNKSNTKFVDIPKTAYSLFSPNAHFGELLLHYTHVGKNAIELFMTKDFECPAEQFIPQHTFSASTRLYFTDQYTVVPEHWKKFYEERGGKQFWKYDIDDPMIGFGFMKIGQLSEILINKEVYPFPMFKEDRTAFNKILVNSKVLSWRLD